MSFGSIGLSDLIVIVAVDANALDDEEVTVII
jgi:hypothetical protein